MPKSVDFLFDFASPNAYLVHRVLPDFAVRTGATVNYIPCLLGGIFKATGNQAPFLSFAPIKGKLDYERLEFSRFIKAHGIKGFQWNPHFPVNSLLLMRGIFAAIDQDRLADFVETGMKAMWEDGLNMADPEVYAATLNAAGFDAQSLLDATQDPDIKARLIANTEMAVDRGAFGIPTFYVGDEMFYGKERLGQVEAAVLD